MAHVQLLQIEIQNLKDALDSSEKKANRYSQLVTTLSDELDKLRSNICLDCQKKLVPGNVSASPGQNFSTMSTSAPFWRRMFQNHQHCLPSRSAVHNSATSESVVPTMSLETIPYATVDTSSTNPGPKQTRISPKAESPEFSVEYNPEVKRALAIHLEHVFAHASPAWSVKINPDGQRMAVGFQNSGATIISNMKTRSNVRVLVDRYVKDNLLIRSVKFGPDGRLLATGASDNKIRIWDITQNRMRAMFKRHTDEVTSISFSPDGRSIVSGSRDCSVCIWNIRDGSSKELPVTDDAAFFFSVVFSPDGQYIAAGDTRGSLSIWDSRTHKLVASWKSKDFVWCVEFTPDGKGLMSGGVDRTVNHWDVSSLGTHEDISGKGTVVPGKSFPLIRRFSGHTDTVYSIAFFPNNDEWVITSSRDRNVSVWDIRTGVWQLVIRGHMGAVMKVDISGTENFFMTASLDCHATLWRYEVL